MMRQLSIRSTGTIEYREIPLYASKRLTSKPLDRGEVYRHTFKNTVCHVGAGHTDSHPLQ